MRRNWSCEGVLSGAVDVEGVWEDEIMLTLHHPSPQSEIHAFVVPMKNINSILDDKGFDRDLLRSMNLAVQNGAFMLGLDQ
jgi:hypothetical protein